MSLTKGARLGSYEIVAPLGAGGMGEVYRARDTKLGRDVAIKMLPGGSRATRIVWRASSAKLTCLRRSTIPNIAAIYGVEDSGDVAALVMELVDGPDTRRRILIGPFRMPRRSRSRVRSAKRSKPRTNKASFIAI